MDGGFHIGGRRILHVGCGGTALPEWLSGEETRLDIDPGRKPDIVAPMDDMGEIGEFDVVYSSHSLEHLTSNGAVKALCEFRRVLSEGGFAVVVVPDLEGVMPTDDVMFTAACGPVTGLDMFYGHHDFIDGKPHMSHKTGFVRATLDSAFRKAGFRNWEARRLPDFNLLGIGVK